MSLISVTESVRSNNLDVKGVIHIGAHYGGYDGEEIKEYVDLEAKRIVLFEPLKENFRVLYKNSEKFNLNKIELHNVALGSHCGLIEMNVSSNDGQSSSILDPTIHLDAHPEVSFLGKEEVGIKTLDEYNINDCNVMVIDVQGYELEVFKGAEKTLKKVDCIFCEVNNEELYKGTPRVEEIDEYLSQYNFKRVETKWWNNNLWGDALYIKEKNKLTNFPLTFFVSLNESEDRRKNLLNQFKEYNFDKYVGILSPRFKDCKDEVIGAYAYTLNDGTKGCCVSHLKAISIWYNNTDEEIAFFCEDDLSLETVKYWNFTWEEFMETLPDDAECVQLLTIRDDFDTFELRDRKWNDWGATAYIMTRKYAKRILDHYITKDSKYKLEIPNSDAQPLVENILFTNMGKVYTIPLFVEENKFQSTFDPGDDLDVKGGQKNNHYIASKTVLDYWKGKMKKSTLEQLLTEYGLDTENPEINFKVGLEYERLGHNAPALSFFLRAAERTEDDLLAYESLIHGSNCYDRQGTRDTTAKGLLQQALCILPNRPEAYYLISRFSGRRNWWQDCYIFADQALRVCDFECEPLSTDVEYVGRYSLIYLKGVAAWWWEKVEESKELLLDILNNHEMNEEFKNLTIKQLELMGYKAEIKTTPRLSIPLKNGIESLSKILKSIDCSIEDLNIDDGGYKELSEYLNELSITQN